MRAATAWSISRWPVTSAMMIRCGA
jgi:hypothetical protein